MLNITRYQRNQLSKKFITWGACIIDLLNFQSLLAYHWCITGDDNETLEGGDVL